MTGFNMSIEKFDRLFGEQHPETKIERWLDLPEDKLFQLTEAVFGQSSIVDKESGDYPTNCILSLEDNRGSPRWVWSCNSLIVLLEKELPLEFDKKAYFVVNKGPTETGKNQTFHQSAAITTSLRGIGGKAPVKPTKKKTTAPCSSSSSLSTSKTHPAKTNKRKLCILEMEEEAGDDDDFIITSAQPPKKARQKQVARCLY